MGTSNNERIALEVASTADPSGVQRMREETTALGQTAKQVAQDLTAAASEGAAAQQSLTTAAAQSADGQSKLQATVEQTREAWARAGGDYEKFKTELAKLVAGEQQLAAATAEAAAAQTQLSAAQTTSATAASTQTQAALQRQGMAMAATHEQALKMNAAFDAQNNIVGQMSPRYRTGAMALERLAFAADGMGGSLQGVIRAAGTLSYSLADMSNNARLAASAAGVGALVITVGALIAAIKHAHDEMNALNTPTGAVADPMRQHIQNLKTLEQVEQALALKQQEQAQAVGRIEAMNDENRLGRAARDIATQDTRQKALQREADLGAEVNALIEKRTQLVNDLHRQQVANLQAIATATDDPVRKFAAELRAIDAEREEAIRTHSLSEAAADAQAIARRRQLTDAQDDAVQKMRNEVGQLAGELQSTTEARRRAIEIQYQQELKALDKVALNEQHHAELLQGINDKRQYGLTLLQREVNLETARMRAETMTSSDNVYEAAQGRLKLIEQERVAAIRAGIDVVTATAQAEEKKRQLVRETARQANENAKTLYQVLESSNDKNLKAVGTFAENVRRLVIGADAARAGVKAAIEGAEAIASLASGDFRGAALHGAAALEFAKASALGFQEAGGGGGSGGGSGAGSGGGPGTFTPRDQQANGPVTVVIQTVDPTSREVMGVVRYELQRQDVTKTPIPSNAAFRPAGAIGAAA